MRLPILLAVIVLAACAAQAPLPAGTTVPPPASPPAATPAATGGTPAAQEGRRLQRALRQSDLEAREDAADGEARRPTGEPGYAPFDEGGMGQMPVMPQQVSPAFRGL